MHSRYRRTVADLPWADRRLLLHLHVQRFFCDQAHCPKRTFAERFGSALPPYARRTARLTANLPALGFATGGHGASRLAQVLAIPISPRTALRIIHRHHLPDTPAPRVVGLDDWAWKKGRTYGSICVDLERHQPIDLLPDREPTTIAAWLHAHPTIEVVARDRGGAFIGGIAQLVNFAKGLRRDYAAVKAGLTLEWSNGQTEAQVHRLKLLKRAMYGQAGFALLRKRVLHRPPLGISRKVA